LAKDDNVIPIPGTTRISRLEENAAATRIVLTKQDLDDIDAVAPTGAAGNRYDDLGMGLVNG